MSSNPVVFITGANTGLGYEVIKSLLQTPTTYTILLGCRTISKGEDAIKTLKSEIPSSKSTISTVQIDVESDDSINAAFSKISKEYGRVDTLINNAGGNFETEAQEGKMSLREAWNKAWNVNVAGTYIMTHTFVPLLIKSSTPRLLFITSGTSALAETESMKGPLARLNQSPEAGWPKPAGPNPVVSYRSSKTGMNMMCRDWVRVLKNDGVKVFIISPGFLATGLNNIGAEKLKQIGARDPSEGGNFVRDVVEGKRDDQTGKAIRVDHVQPW